MTVRQDTILLILLLVLVEVVVVIVVVVATTTTTTSCTTTTTFGFLRLWKLRNEKVFCLRVRAAIGEENVDNERKSERKQARVQGVGPRVPDPPMLQLMVASIHMY